MTPGNQPLRNYLPERGKVPSLTNGYRATRDAVDNLRADVMANRSQLVPDGRIVQPRVAVVTHKGPKGDEPEPLGNWYWCKWQRLKWDSTKGVPAYEDETKPGIADTVVAMNVGELTTQHGLRNDKKCYVRLFKSVLPLATPIIAWQFERAPTPVYMRITAATKDGSNFRWKYSATEVEVSNYGFGNWATAATTPITLPTAPSSSTAGWDYLYNLIEDANGATGTFGNGVSSTNLTGTLAVQPIPTGTVVKAWIKWPDAADRPFMVCEYPNGVDGGC